MIKLYKTRSKLVRYIMDIYQNFVIIIDEADFYQMIIVAPDVMTVYLQDRRARSSSKSTNMVPAKNSPMPKLCCYFWVERWSWG